MKELKRLIRKILKESKHGMMFGQEMGETRSPEEIAKSMLLEAIENSETEVFNHPDGPGGIRFNLPSSNTVIEVNYMGQIECK
tara:strand:+ start:12783 stop:13031 length:249 start_codon:yes stop_codon:yes gene_type:complete